MGLDYPSNGPGTVTVKVILADGREVMAEQKGQRLYAEGREIAPSEVREVLRPLNG